MINAVEIGTLAFAAVFYASLIAKQHIAYRNADVKRPGADVTE